MEHLLRRMAATALTGLLTATVVATTAPAASAKGGEVGGNGNVYLLSDATSATTTSFAYGRRADEVFVGDWDGDGTDTVAVRRGSTFHVSNSFTGGNADTAFTYGRPGDVVLVGDWNGDGVDTFAVRRGAEYHVKNSLAGGPADRAFRYGRDGDTVLVGDWDADDADTFSVRRGAEYHVKNSLAGGPADQAVRYGRAGDTVLVGDWDGDGDDTFTVRRGMHYHVANEIRGGSGDRLIVYGQTDDTVLVGDWDGDGVDTLGVRRSSTGLDPGGPVDGSTGAERGELTSALNEFRREEGRHTLSRDPDLDRIAQEQAEWMALHGELQHNPNLRQELGPSWNTRSEIIVRHTYIRNMTTEQILDYMHDWWRGSRVHRENMQRPSFTHVGTGYAVYGNAAYGVHVFAG